MAPDDAIKLAAGDHVYVVRDDPFKNCDVLTWSQSHRTDGDRMIILAEVKEVLVRVDNTGLGHLVLTQHCTYNAFFSRDVFVDLQAAKEHAQTIIGLSIRRLRNLRIAIKGIVAPIPPS